ncbi:MAG: plastocyanin [Synechococcaceae cyanobacterium RL_1_2]|nr:plastocyanin [Synechococcaceae cyanobacterium RL_1_2]
MAKFFKQLGLVVATFCLVVAGLAISAPQAAAANVTIKMGADNGMLAFQPKEVEVSPGDTIQWDNNKMFPHNIVFEDAALADLSHQGLLNTGNDDYTSVVPADLAPGSYTFFCAPHRGAGMVGKLIVK